MSNWFVEPWQPAPKTGPRGSIKVTPCSPKSRNKSDCEGENALKAMKAGLSVFVSEWGTGTADGKGNLSQENGANAKWQTFVDKYKLSWANWSASHISETTAAFASGSNKYGLQYSTSGNMALNISGVDAANVELFDLKGNKLMMIDGVVGTLSLAKLPAGMYMVKVSSGSASKMQAISIR